MSLEISFLCTDLWTELTVKCFDVTNTMNRRQVLFQVASLCKLPAAMLALMLCVSLLWSAAAAALSMRRVVVSDDR